MFLLDRHNLGGKRGPAEPAIHVEFERLGKGKEEGTACFRGDFHGHRLVSSLLKDKTKNVIMRRWHENNEKRKPELPNYTICIGDMVNDTHIPGLVIDVEEYVIHFEWRGMLELFFREQARFQELKTICRRSHPPICQTTPTHKPKGGKSASAEPQLSWQDMESELRRSVRRARLKEYYRDNVEMVWAIDSLKYFEKASSAKWSSESPRMLPHLPGAGLGERWFGSTNLVQELYLDECSSTNRIETQMALVDKQKGD